MALFECCSDAWRTLEYEQVGGECHMQKGERELSDVGWNKVARDEFDSINLFVQKSFATTRFLHFSNNCEFVVDGVKFGRTQRKKTLDQFLFDTKKTARWLPELFKLTAGRCNWLNKENRGQLSQSNTFLRYETNNRIQAWSESKKSGDRSQ